MAECTKRGYPNERQARRANKHMGNTIRPYRCPECKQIHVTKDRVPEAKRKN